jgi:branched-chain amino acid transport system substrate-binding protein
MRGKMFGRYMFIATLVSVMVLAFSGLAPAQDTVKAGVAGAHTGDLASYGLSAARGAEYVQEQINAKGGMKVDLVMGDEQCKPELATNVATKMVSDGVRIVMGHICSGATLAALGIYKDANVVVISPSATNVDLTESGDYPNFFRTIARDDAQSRLQYEFAKKKGLKKIAVIHDKEDYGKGLADLVKKDIEADPDMEVVLYEGITRGGMDYSAVVQKIKRSEAEAVIYGGYHPEASKLVTQMRKKKMDTLFISDDGVKDDTFIKVAGEYAEGVYATGPKDVSTNPMAIAATKWHKDKYQADPGAFFLNGVAATQALLNAWKVTNGGDFDQLVDALRTKPVDTPLGAITFDEKGDAKGVGFLMYQVKDGVYVEVTE